MTCTVKSPLVQGLHQAKRARPVETWARFLSISLTLIEFFSSIYFYCISGSGHGDPHFICCMPYIVNNRFVSARGLQQFLFCQKIMPASSNYY